jgi:hypothetical protein
MKKCFKVVFYYSNTQNDVLSVVGCLLLFVVYVNYVCMIQYGWLIFCYFSKWRRNIEKPTESDIISYHNSIISKDEEALAALGYEFNPLKPPLHDIFHTLWMLFKCSKVECFYAGNMNQIYGVILWSFIALMDSKKFLCWNVVQNYHYYLNIIFTLECTGEPTRNCHLDVKNNMTWRFVIFVLEYG